MTSQSKKPIASLSQDLDNKWFYMKIHGYSGREKFPSYFDVFITLILDILDEMNLKIVFFLVGQDAALEKNHEAMRQIIVRGHEVGNHSFHHEPWIHTYTAKQIEREILENEKCRIEATGKKPVGFRGSGFNWSKYLLEVVMENGYLYDAPTLPMSLGPLMRLYYFWKSDLNEGEKTLRKDLYGSFKDGFKPVKAYLWQLPAGKRFLEIPVTTIPIIKIPFHLSYLLYLSRFSMSLMFFYLNVAIAFCKITKTSPGFLLHPLDLVGIEHSADLPFFPGIDISADKNKKVFYKVMIALLKHFNLVNMSTYAKVVLKRKNLSVIDLRMA
jgi:hypothetical protein